MMTPEERYEFEQELRDESRQEEIHEHRMRADYDYFIDEVENQHSLAEFSKWYKDIENMFEQYGYEFDIKDFL